MTARRQIADVLTSVASATLRAAGRGNGPSGKMIVSLTFDDGWASHYDEARPILDRHGMRGTFFINSALVGTKGRITWEQLGEMAAEGHEIGGHTLDHADLTALDEAEARRQICEDRDALLAHGFAARSFAYPRGAFDAVTTSLVRECGYSSARAAYGLRNLDQPPGDRRPLVERLPLRDPYRILTPCCLWSTTGLERLVTYIEAAERRGGWVPLVFHRVCDDCGGEDPAPSIDPDTFSSFLGWLERRAPEGTVVLTLGDVVALEKGEHAAPEHSQAEA